MTVQDARAVCQQAMLAIPVWRATGRVTEANALLEAVGKTQAAAGHGDYGLMEDWTRWIMDRMREDAARKGAIR